MPAVRRSLPLSLVVGLALGCSATSSPPPLSQPWASRWSPSMPQATINGLSAAPALPAPSALPAHEVIAGPNITGAFDLATDGTILAWSNGTVDVDAPDLWTLDSASGEQRLLYHSAKAGAILANLAVHRGTYAFAEVTPGPGGSRTWRLVLVDPAGHAHVLDTNDVPTAQIGTLPMAAISDRGVLWAGTHAGDAASPRCQLRYASLVDLRARILASELCSRTEYWYPRSDGIRFVYGTVEYGPDHGADDRHVYLAADATLQGARRLDLDGEASLPAIAGDAVVWKAAPRALNMFSPAGLELLDLSVPGLPGPVPFGASASTQLTTPSIGPRFVVAEDTAGSGVGAWDRARSSGVEIDRLASSDPGFISGTRLVGRLLAWFHTSSTQGGGTREVRWLTLPSD
jgi:hypothetical protein